MTLILSLLLFNVGFLLGSWWATRVAIRKSQARASLPQSRSAVPETEPPVPLRGYDTVVSQN